MDRLGQLLGLLGALGARGVELGQLLLGDEIDRTDPLALRGQPFERRRLPASASRGSSGSNPSFSGSRCGTHSNFSTAGAGELRAARLLRFGAGGGGGAALARVGASVRWPRDTPARPRRPPPRPRARRSTASPILHLALVVGTFELARLSTSSSAGSFSSSGPLRSLLRLPLDALREPLLGVGRAACATRACSRAAGAQPLAVGRGLARPGRRFRALVGDRGRGRLPQRPRAASTSCSSAAGSGSAASERSRRADAPRARLPAPAPDPPGAARAPLRWASIRSSAAARHRWPGRHRERRARRRAPACAPLRRSPGIAPSAARASSRSGARGIDRLVAVPASSSASCASRLARSSRSAAAAPDPFATKPSQRRSTPSRVTSRWPTASGWPSSSSATAIWFRRRSKLGGRSNVVGEALGAGGQGRIVAMRFAARSSGAAPSPPMAASDILAERRGQRALVAGHRRTGWRSPTRRHVRAPRPRRHAPTCAADSAARAAASCALRGIASLGSRGAALLRFDAAGFGLRQRARAAADAFAVASRCARLCSLPSPSAASWSASRARSCSVRPSCARAASSAASATRRSARIAACRASSSASAASASRDMVSAMVSSVAIRADCPSASPSRCSIACRSCSSCADRARRVALERFLARKVGAQRSVEPVELGEPPRHRVAPRARGRELVGEGVALLAQLGEGGAASPRAARSPARARACASAIAC